MINEEGLEKYNLHRKSYEIMRNLEHPNILKVHLVREIEGKLYIISEQLEEIRLDDYLLEEE
eukprot:CAMPEP_0170555678 /NCGR_PEP_ID=MMETSP0211-20121228/13541_1 /TAXON_ID=311385 /ORGANISM="Pseudokeronopsis sp., Strain OXSARD2" /LENGTH=61 /DNA_ID=CAMNT_0010865645 /DNA_START=172 /DNA_END=357 /DNA_ORIENTATION=+